MHISVSWIFGHYLCVCLIVFQPLPDQVTKFHFIYSLPFNIQFILKWYFPQNTWEFCFILEWLPLNKFSKFSQKYKSVRKVFAGKLECRFGCICYWVNCLFCNVWLNISIIVGALRLKCRLSLGQCLYSSSPTSKCFILP